MTETATPTVREFNQCPSCGYRPCHYRHGLHFDHEMRCSRCNACFDPWELWLREEEKRLEYNTFKE